MSFVVLSLGLIATGFAQMLVARNAHAIDEQRFEEAINALDDAIKLRMQTYIGALRGARGLFAARGTATRDEFRAWVDAAEVAGRYPGVQGFGWAEAVPAQALAAHVASVRASGDSGYLVWPDQGAPLRAPVVFLEPLDWRNRRAIGFDMFSDPTRRGAMELSRDDGNAVMSGRVMLVQESELDRQPGFLVYLPVYRLGAPLATVEQRRAAILGWVYMPFRARDLLDAVFAHEPARHLVDVEVWDGPRSPDALLYGSASDTSARLTRTIGLLVAGRTWTLTFATRPEFERDSRRALPYWVLGAGVLVSVLLFVLSEEQTRRRLAAEALVQRTTVLAQAGSEIAGSLEVEATLRSLVRQLTTPNEGAAKDEDRSAFADGCAIVVEDDPRAAVEGESRRELARAGLDPEAALSTLEIPLIARGERIGKLVLLRGAARARFDDADRALGTELARLVASAIDSSRLYRAAQSAVRVRDDFLSIASHELRTPITALRLQAQLLGRAVRKDADPKSAELLERLERQSVRVSRLIDNLLDISRIANGKLELVHEDVDLTELAREVVQRAQVMGNASGVTLTLNEHGAVVGSWDRLRLEQVVTNLVTNAIKYGNGKPVDVTVRGDDDTASVSVRDRGIGIERAAIDRIFGRFERAVTTRQYAGLGLGLYITRQIVDAHGGTITVDSTPGEGSTFTVTLPRA